jgi:hypothetical protein
LAIAAVFLASGSPARMQQAVSDTDTLYILAYWTNYLECRQLFGSPCGKGSTDATFVDEVQQIRRRLGDGNKVRTGFSVPIYFPMDSWTVNTTDTATIRTLISQPEGVVDQIDRAIARARQWNLPIHLLLQTATRETMDAAQTASQTEDRRNMQWYNTDNGMAPGWWTYSRYARKQYALREAYVRELGKIVANRMARYPGILVSASGDAEIEMTYERSCNGLSPAWLNNPANQCATNPPGKFDFADYSPFSVAEFRDWLRGEGLYATGQPFAGQAYALASRYRGDASPAIDSNADGHTVNGDWGTSFTSWQLRYFDWLLSDPTSSDPNAIPASVYNAPGFNPLPDAGATRFDAPRTRQPGVSWWDLFNQFRDTQIWRYQQDFGKWMTTSTDPATNTTIPTTRWYAYQIPADQIFGNVGTDLRYFTSASTWWSADVSPYGGAGYTSFNVNRESLGIPPARTYATIAPLIAGRKLRHGLIEWKASTPFSTNLQVYRDEMALVKQYKPNLLAPFSWDATSNDDRVKDTQFEVALKELITEIRSASNPGFGSFDTPATGSTQAGEVALTGWAADDTVVQQVELYRSPVGAEPTASNGYVFLGYGSLVDGARPDIQAAYPNLPYTERAGWGYMLLTNMLPNQGNGQFTFYAYVKDELQSTLLGSKTITISNNTATKPFGTIDTPAQGATVSGTMTNFGWALTPQPNSIPTNGSTIEVYIDNIFRGRPTYNQFRSDIATLFPGYANSNGAVGFFQFDTRTLSNGVHTIQWIVRDSAGNAQGIGSRYFTVVN